MLIRHGHQTASRVVRYAAWRHACCLFHRVGGNAGSNGGAMTIEERAIGSVVVLDVSGRLVLGDGDQLLKDRVASHFEKGNRHLLLNVSKLSYVDSSGLGVIVAS